MIARRHDECPKPLRAKGKEGKTLTETARVMGCSREWVRLSQESALQKIHACLQSTHTPGSIERLAEQRAIAVVARWLVECQDAKCDATESLVRLVKGEILGERSGT